MTRRWILEFLICFIICTGLIVMAAFTIPGGAP